MTKLLIKVAVAFLICLNMLGCFRGEKTLGNGKMEDKITPLYRAYVRYPYRNLDPAVLDDGGSSFVATQIYCTLFEQTAYLDIKELLLESWSLDNTRTIYDFKLRDDISFSNGTKITADDVVFSLNRLLRKDSVVYTDFRIVKTIVKTSPSTFAIHLKKPFPLFLYFLTTANAAIVPKGELRAQGRSFFEKPIGCGPFVLQGIDDRKMTLVANDLAVHKPYIRTLEFHYNLSTQEAIRRFKEGELDDISMAWFNPVSTDLGADYNVVDSLVFQSYFVMLHKEKKPFSSDIARDLFIHLFDRNKLMRLLADKRLEPANGLIPRGIIGFNSNEHIYKTTDCEDAHVAAQIKTLKSQMKLPVDVTLTVSNVFNKAAFEETIKSNGINKIFNIKLESETPETVMNRYYDRYGDAILMGDDLRYPDPYLILRYFKSDNPYNDVYVKSGVIDNYIDEAILEDDKHKRAVIYSALEKEIEREAVILPLFYGDMASGVIKNYVLGFEKPYGGEDYIRYNAIWAQR